MGQINIYKIDTHKYNDFETELTRKYVSSDPITRVVAVGDIERLLTLTLHTATTDEENYVEWKWLLSCFDEETLTTRTNPKSILVVDDGDLEYTFSFSFSFLLLINIAILFCF